MADEYLLTLRKITKRVSHFRGFGKMTYIIRRIYSVSNKNIVITDFDDDLYFECDLNEHITNHIFWRGYYSRNELLVLRQFIRPEMVVVDVGANKGEFSIFAAKRLTQGKVIAFEPVKTNYDLLERNIAGNNFTNIQLVKKGLGSTAEKMSIFKTVDGHWPEKHRGLYTLFGKKSEANYYGDIDIISLDQYCKQENVQQIDIIKIDIEGSELERLRGAREILKKFMPVIIIEVNAVTSRAAGYEASAILA